MGFGLVSSAPAKSAIVGVVDFEVGTDPALLLKELRGPIVRPNNHYDTAIVK